MANHLEPPPPNYRDRFEGIELVEMHVLAGNWDEFDLMIRQNPKYAHAVLNWVCTDESVDHLIYEHAKRRARTALMTRSNAEADGTGGRSVRPSVN